MAQFKVKKNTLLTYYYGYLQAKVMFAITAHR